MNAGQLVTKLTFAEVDGRLARDARRLVCEEREALSAAIASGDGKAIAAAMAEAQRVAKMWGVKL